MLHALSEKIADFLLDKNDEYPLEVYTYGMELIISTLVEFLILLIIGVFLGELVDTLIFVVSFSLIRFYTGGYHAKTYFRCGVVTVITFLSVLISAKLLLFFNSQCLAFTCFVVFVFSLYIISKYSPIENENKELYDKKRLKIIAILIYLLEIIIFIAVYKLLKLNRSVPHNIHTFLCVEEEEGLVEGEGVVIRRRRRRLMIGQSLDDDGGKCNDHKHNDKGI